MPTYICTGFDPSLQPVRRRLQAPTRKEAMHRLQRMHVTVTDIRVDWRALLDAELMPSKLSADELHLFCDQLATMLGAGIAIVRSLRTLADLMQGRVTKRLALDLARRIEEGCSLTEALQYHEALLPPVLMRMVAAAEASGRLQETLVLLAAQFEQEADVRRKVKGAMTYPAFIMVMGIAANLFYLTVVLPQFSAIYADMGAELPAATRMLIKISAFLRSYGWALPLLVVGLWLVLRALIRKTPPLRKQIAAAALAAPILGDLNRKRQAATFMRTLAGLFGSGVPVVRALGLAGGTLTNPLLRSVADSAASRVAMGGQLTGAFRESRLFPPILVEMMAVGEESGDLEAMLLKAAAQVEAELKGALEQLGKVLEPLLIVILTGSVAAVFIPTMLPVLTLSSHLSN